MYQTGYNIQYVRIAVYKTYVEWIFGPSVFIKQSKEREWYEKHSTYVQNADVLTQILYIVPCLIYHLFLTQFNKYALVSLLQRNKHDFMTPSVGWSPTGAKIFVTLFVTLGKALYSNCSVVQRSRKAVSPVYMYLNINTSVHVKERHRLFEKSRGSSWYCWMYFKTTLIYSRFQSMGQGRLWPIWVPKISTACLYTVR